MTTGVTTAILPDARRSGQFSDAGEAILGPALRATLKGMAVLAVVLGLTACAGPAKDGAPGDGADAPDAQTTGYDEPNDPLEPVNRAIFDFNLAVDRVVLTPAAKGYELLPDLIRDAVRNFLNNLRAPVILANDLMQGELERAGDTMGRFIFNTLIVGGLFDPASDAGVPHHDEDFGQTLAVWGVDSGPFLMLPLLGPSNLRDTGGFVVDRYLDPVTYWADNSSRDWASYAPIIRGTVDAIDLRSRNYRQLQDLQATSLDFYATVRSLYRQQRRTMIENSTEPGAPTPAIGLDGGYSAGGLDSDADSAETKDTEGEMTQTSDVDTAE